MCILCAQIIKKTLTYEHCIYYFNMVFLFRREVSFFCYIRSIFAPYTSSFLSTKKKHFFLSFFFLSIKNFIQYFLLCSFSFIKSNKKEWFLSCGDVCINQLSDAISAMCCQRYLEFYGICMSFRSHFITVITLQ